MWPLAYEAVVKITRGTSGCQESLEIQQEANALHCTELKLTKWLVVASEQTAVVACDMSARDEHFLDMMQDLSTSLGHLLFLGSCHVSPSSCGRSPGHGGRAGGGSSRGPVSSSIAGQVGKAKVKASKKGKEKAVEAPEEWSEVELGGEDEDDTNGEEAA